MSNWLEKLNARKAAGLKSKNNGKAFEDIFEKACQSVRLSCTPFPEGCKRVGLKRLIQIPTPWDYILTHKGTSAMIDTKSVGDRAFAHSQIKEHQAVEMALHQSSGAIGGYLVWLRKTSSVIFIPATQLLQCLGTRGSIKEHDPGVISIGHIVESTLNGTLYLGRLFTRGRDQ